MRCGVRREVMKKGFYNGLSLLCIEDIGVMKAGFIVYCFHDDGPDGYFWVMTGKPYHGVTQFKFTHGCKKYFRAVE